MRLHRYIMIWHGGRRYQLLEISRVDGEGGYIRESEFSGIGWVLVGWVGLKKMDILFTCFFRETSSFQLSHLSLFLLLRSLVCSCYDLWVRY